MNNIQQKKLSDCIVFFDFDNTITHFDVLDDIIARFSDNGEWATFEKDWREGRIGSRECLQGQLRSVRINRQALSEYLSRIKIDPFFSKLIALLKDKGIKVIILSDNFSFILEHILRNNGTRGLEVYSNRLSFRKDRLIPSFPYLNRRCLRCGHCKTKHLQRKSLRSKIIVYIGDGLSDVCPAQKADLVFAKGSLLEYFKKNKRACLAFKDLRYIYKYFKERYR